MVEGGEWTTTKLINLILGIILLVIIIAGSLSGQLDPLIDQVGAKFDEWIIKNKQTQRDSEIIGDLEVNPDGICKLLNVGENKNNYTFDYYPNEDSMHDFYLNGVQVNNKIINDDLTTLKKDRDLYYAIIQILEEEGMSQNLGKESRLFKISDDKDSYQLLWENGLGYLLVEGSPSKEELSFKELENKILNNELPVKTEVFFKSWDSSGNFLEGGVSEIHIITTDRKDLPSSLAQIWQEISEKQNAAYPLGYNLDSLYDWIMENKRVSLGGEKYNLDYTFNPGENYPLLELENTKTKKIFIIQFTSNYLYFMDLVSDGKYRFSDINRANFRVFIEDENGDTIEYPTKEYILTDEAFNEMTEINTAYRELEEKCV